MFVFSDSLVYNTCVIVITIFVTTFAFFKWKFTFWERHGVPVLSSTSTFGILKDALFKTKNPDEILLSLYYGPKRRGLKHVGSYFLFKPMYIPLDPDLIKNILQRDFAYFMNHGLSVNERDDPLNAHLFNLEDSKWRNMRVKLTQTFTSAKMKMMFQTILDCSHGLRDIIDKSFEDKTPIDARDTIARFTTDVISSAAFGIDCNSLKNPDTEFRIYCKKALKLGLSQRVSLILTQILPDKIIKLLKLKATSNEVEEFFMKVIRDTIEYREKNSVFRKDFMHLLIQLKNLGKITDDGTLKLQESEQEESLSFNELAAQAFVFFFAGFDTTSTMMTFTLFELAQNEEIQEKLRNELNTILTKHDNKLTYQSVNEMKYLEQVLNESLRKHPLNPHLIRICTKDYVIPELSSTVPKGTRVMINSYGLHHDPQYYPDPERFDPERFSEENKAKRHPFVWLPFGEGPRLCIGMRFAMLQSKIGLVSFLKDYQVTLNKKTKLPMQYDMDNFILNPKGEIWIDVVKI